MPKPTLASRVRAAREQVGLSQAQAAERAGVPLSTLLQIEQGRRRNPQFFTMVALAVAIEMDLNLVAKGLVPPKKEVRK